jgi:hypothetical protein
MSPSDQNLYIHEQRLSPIGPILKMEVARTFETSEILPSLHAAKGREHNQDRHLGAVTDWKEPTIVTVLVPPPGTARHGPVSRQFTPATLLIRVYHCPFTGRRTDGPSYGQRCPINSQDTPTPVGSNKRQGTCVRFEVSRHSSQGSCHLAPCTM